MAWYSTGTIQVAAGGTVATGTGTAFLGNVRVGDGITIAGSTAQHEVIGVTSDTQLTFSPAYAGTAGSGKAYKIVPVNGYDKDLSDAFNTIRLQWGSTLASLQPWAYAASAALARQQLGANDAANINVGTLPNAQVSATLSPDKAFRRGNILGTVSQSGGTPTGAIIERGSNANGEYVRFADGTQIAFNNALSSNVAIDLPMVGGFRSGGVAWQYPASFTGGVQSISFVSGDTLHSGAAVTSIASNQVVGVLLATTSQSAQPRITRCIAIGRWY